MTPFWSSVINAYSKKDFYWLKKIIYQLLIFFAFLSILVYLPLYYYSDNIFEFWLGYHFQTSNLLIMACILNSLILCFMTIAMNFVNGISKIKVQLFLYAFSSICNIPLSIFLCNRYGIPGVSISSTIIFSIMSLVLWVQVFKVLNNSATGIWSK